GFARPACVFFVPGAAAPALYTLSLHDALPIFHAGFMALTAQALRVGSDRKGLYLALVAIGVAALLLTKSRTGLAAYGLGVLILRSEEHTSELQSRENLVCRLLLEKKKT